MSSGDYVEYTFDVVNDGDYDATLTGLQKTDPSCQGTGDNASTDASNVCGKLTYTLTYEDGTTVSQNDTLASKETKTMKLKLLYQTFNDDSLLPKADVTISGLGITLTYTQDGNAKVNSDGTTPLITYDTYSVGDQITVVGEQYYVIADSPATDDYVVALKANPLTTSEITTYGTGHVNVYNSQNGAVYDIQGIGGMAYYTSSLCGPQNPERPWQSIDDECITSYGQSEVKYSVDAWAAAKFTDELKTVDGYSARLITYEELVTGLGCTTSNCSNSLYSWTYDSNYSYYTMTPWQYGDQPSSTDVWSLYSEGSLAGFNVYSFSGAIRPVINVYKSAISS